MTEAPFTPDEFNRLLSLSEQHPDRVRAEASGKLEAWRRMLGEFEAPLETVASPDELASADAALERHLAGALVASPEQRSVPVVRETAGPGLWARLAGALSGPVARPALAVLVVVVAAGSAWWAGSHRVPRAVRGGDGASAIVVTTRAADGAALELSWAAVAGADEYRVRFFGGTLREIARLDHVTGPMLRLERNSLPAGLHPGAELMVEVAAVRRGDVIAVSNPRAMRLP
jgi:type IV secretory pathway VirB2 component (pilin)